MFKRLVRAKDLIMARGFKGFLAQLLRYVAYRIETITFSRFIPHVGSAGTMNFGTVGRINEIGAVTARTIPDVVNSPISVPFTDSGQIIDFDRVAVIAHIFYPEVTDAIADYFRHIPVPYGLFITTDTEEKRTIINAALSKSAIDAVETEIRVVPNRGRDVAPKYIAFADVYRRYPAFLHIHSKQSLHAGNAYSSWRDYLLNALIGSKEIAESNLKLLSNRNVGVVYPEHAEFIKPVVNWGFDFPIARELLSRVGVTLDVYNILEFPSGSMYWGRSDAIKQLLDLNLNYKDFPEEAGQVDGTLAHAIERSLLLFVEKAGFQWVRVKTVSQKMAETVSDEYPVFEPLITSSQAYIPTTQRMYQETLRIKAVPVLEDRKRINLIVPSLRAAEIFGGIDTALKVFCQLTDAASSDVDFRVIVSDASLPEELPKILSEYTPQRLGSERRERRTVVDATNRLDHSLQVTRNDVFVATAWWTALNAFRLHDFQKTVFGSAPKIIYLIQDFEPGFYGWSTKYALADSTYKRPDDTISVFNSEELERYFEKHYLTKNISVLPYRINMNIEASLQSIPRERIILFYSRPSAVRNCFEAGIDGLNLWARRNPDKAASWKIYCIGEAFPAHQLGELQNTEITGKMSLEAYAELLSKASVGLSLMVSPHPSYPPLEMAYAGVSTITNSYECKDISKRSDNITSLGEITPESIASALDAAVLAAEKKVGEITPVRCPILDIPTNAPMFAPDEILKSCGLLSPRSLEMHQ